MSTLDELRARHGAQPGVQFASSAELGYRTDEARDCVVLENAHGRAVVALSGAQVLAYAPAGRADVLWMSPRSRMAPGVAIRGGIPLCAPWFGPGAEGLPQHGYARTSDWEVEVAGPAAGGATAVTLVLPAVPGDGGPMPRDVDMRLTVTLGPALRLDFSAVNRSAATRPFECAFHSYFSVGDASKAAVEGLDGCEVTERVTNTQYVQAGAVRLDLPKTLDAVYLDPAETLVLRAPAGDVAIWSTSRACVVWNPGEAAAKVADIGGDCYPEFICVERADVKARAAHLAPGDRYDLAMTLTAL